jgi:uncharacterized protein (TIGR02757 family)
MNNIRNVTPVTPTYYKDVHDFLESKYEFYNQPAFIASDPISVPHQFTKKEDIEIAAFLTATLSWGTRTSIIKNANDLLDRMGGSPYEFIMHYKENELTVFSDFAHRTFNSDDCICYMQGLKNIYRKGRGFEYLFTENMKGKSSSPMNAISNVRKLFFKQTHLPRTEKHFANPEIGSAAKRLNMFLRWMVRDDGRGVDFGLWKNISPSKLLCPLDVHSGNAARKLDLLTRKVNDRRSAEELTNALKLYDPNDPAKYDFALFGLGVNENF